MNNGKSSVLPIIEISFTINEFHVRDNHTDCVGEGLSFVEAVGNYYAALLEWVHDYQMED